MSKSVLDVEIAVLPDNDPDTSYLDQEGFEDRKAAFMRDEFDFVGVRAQARVLINDTEQIITSGGLWGIESDSGDTYLLDVAAEEMNALNAMLIEMGLRAQELPTSLHWK